IRASPLNRLNMEVQIRSHPIRPWTAAVIYAPTADRAVVPKEPPALKPPGDWNTMEIEAVGPRVKVTVNGKLANDVDLTKTGRSKSTLKEKGVAEAKLDRKRGRSGLESLKGPIKFRNIRVTDLSK